MTTPRTFRKYVAWLWTIFDFVDFVCEIWFGNILAVKITPIDDHRVNYSCPCHAQNSTWCIQQSTNTIVRAAAANTAVKHKFGGGESGGGVNTAIFLG